MVELIIRMDAAGHVSVEGPVEERLVCYGLLEMAREAIHAHHVLAAKRLVQPATVDQLPGPHAFGGNGRG